MGYPKPLSQKTIVKRYQETGLSQKQIDFLKELFSAAANLYGVISLNELWDVYKELAEKVSVPKIRKAALGLFSEVARRDDVPYYVFEIDELYSEELRMKMERQIVQKEVIWHGWSKYAVFYKLADMQQGKPFFVPTNMLSYSQGIPSSDEEKELRTFLDELKATAATLQDKYGRKKESSTHVGKKLKDFSYYTFSEQGLIDYYEEKYVNNPKRRESQIRKYQEMHGGAFSEKLFRDIRFRTITGWIDPQKVLEYLLDDLQEAGVELTESQLQELLERMMAYHNTTHLYANRGWTPTDLARSLPRSDKIAVSLGPGIQKAIADGDLDLMELKKEFESRGITFLED